MSTNLNQTFQKSKAHLLLDDLTNFIYPLESFKDLQELQTHFQDWHEGKKFHTTLQEIQNFLVDIYDMEINKRGNIYEHFDQFTNNGLRCMAYFDVLLTFQNGIDENTMFTTNELEDFFVKVYLANIKKEVFNLYKKLYITLDKEAQEQDILVLLRSLVASLSKQK